MITKAAPDMMSAAVKAMYASPAVIRKRVDGLLSQSLTADVTTSCVGHACSHESHLAWMHF